MPPEHFFKIETPELHGVFATTIFGDRIRVSHYGPWGEIIDRWNLLDRQREAFTPNGLVKFYEVRSWTDDGYMLSRYVSLDTLIEEDSKLVELKRGKIVG